MLRFSIYHMTAPATSPPLPRPIGPPHILKALANCSRHPTAEKEHGAMHLRLILLVLASLALLAACGTAGQADYDRGYWLREDGDLDGAFAAFNDAIDANDKFALAYNDRGEIYLARGEIDLAFADFDRAIEIDDELEYAFANRSEAHLLLGDVQGALADATRAIELGPTGSRCPRIIHGAPTRATCSGVEVARAHFFRGLAHFALGDADQALTDLDRAVLLDQDYAPIFYARSRTHLALCETDLALADADQAILIDPELAAAYRTRGEIHQSLGNASQAQADFDQADAMYGQGTGGDITNTPTTPTVVLLEWIWTAPGGSPINDCLPGSD